jgi:hypothetical protein
MKLKASLVSAVVVIGVGVGGFMVWHSQEQSRPSTADEVRMPRGIWCTGEVCEFWDTSGARWGRTVPSVGSLLLLVQDERMRDVQAEARTDGDARIFSGILSAIEGIASLSLQAKFVTIPDAEPGGIRITLMSGYDLLIDAHGDVADQLSTLGVFLADRAKDPGFHPQYIDMRTPGRIYYK